MSGQEKKKKHQLRLKAEYTHEEDEEVDVGMLPSLVLGEELLEVAQQLTKDPTNLSLVTRIKNAVFKDQNKANKIMGVVATEVLASIPDIGETAEEQFQNIPGVLIDMFVPSGSNTDVEDDDDNNDDEPSFEGAAFLEAENGSAPQPKESEKFVDVTTSLPSTSEQPVLTGDKDVGKTLLGKTLIDYLETFRYNMLTHIEMLMTNQVHEAGMRQAQIDLIQQSVSGFKSDLVEICKKLDNIEHLQCTQKNLLAELARRLGFPTFLHQVVVPPPETVMEEKRLKDDINVDNLNTMINALIKYGLMENTESGRSLLKDFFMLSDPVQVKFMASTLHYTIEPELAALIASNPLRKIDECNFILKSLVNSYTPPTKEQIIAPAPQTVPVTTVTRPPILKKMSKRG